MSGTGAGSVPRTAWDDRTTDSRERVRSAAGRGKGLYTRSAICCGRPLASLLGALALLLPAACRSPLRAGRDAGRGPDAGPPYATPDAIPYTTPDAAPDVATADLASPDRFADLPLAPDLAPPDLSGSELLPTTGVPQGFRIENHTDRTAYVPTDPPVMCGALSGSALGPCNFLNLGCLSSCDSIPAGTDCCVQCEQPQPAVIAIPPGGSHVVPWDGNLHAKATGACSVCECEAVAPAGSGTYQASTHAAADYQCLTYPCSVATDGLIPLATTNYAGTRVLTTFTIPSPDPEVVLVIDSLPKLDAGVALDLPPPVDLAVTRDTLPDGIPDTFAGLPGHTFGIAASNTAPDASSDHWNWPCRPSDPNATYNLIFSDDGTKVHIVRTDPVQEETMDGVRTAQSDAQLVYSIDNHWAGAELAVRIDNGALVAQLAVFGSGVPVVMCIQSPMMLQ